MRAGKSHLSRVLISVGILVLLLISTVPIRTSSNASSAPWAMFRGNPQHTGRSLFVGPSTNSTKWKFATGGPIYSSPAIGSDGTVYVGSFDGYLYAISPDGTLRWKFQSGGQVESSPAIASDGTVYIGSDDGSMYAVDPDGTLKWRFSAGYHGLGSSPTIGPDGTIYFGGSYCCVYALNPDGSLKWNATTDAGVNSSPAIGPDGTIYVGGYDYHLYALTPDGQQKWKMFTPGAVYASPAVGPGGTVYVGVVGPFLSNGILLAVTPDGNQKWSFPVSQPILSSAAIAPDGTLYFDTLSGNRALYALNPDGSLKWNSFSVGISSPTIGADGTVYAANSFGTLLSLNQSGRPMWYYETGIDDYIGSSPSIGPDGTLYVGAYDGYLYAIGSSASSSTATTSTSASPVTSLTTNTTTASTTAHGCHGFAHVENATLTLCGHPFNFVGTVEPTILAAYLGLPYSKVLPEVPDPNTLLADAASHGMKVVRFFLELADTPGGGDGPYAVGNSSSNAPCQDCKDAFAAFWQVYSKEPDHRTYFQSLDELIADAKRNGVYLMPELALCFGCWSKLGNGTDFFQVGSPANEVWKAFVGSVVSHFSNESQILWWDLAGEANNEIGQEGPCVVSSCVLKANLTSPTEMSAWGNDSYDFIKSLDPNHLVEGGWNLPWSGFYSYFGNAQNTQQKVVSEYDNMTFFRALNARFDVASLHMYDSDIYFDEQFIGANDLQNGTARFVEHYAAYSRDVLKKPFFIDETGGQYWEAPHFFRIGYSPDPFVKYLLRDVIKYHVVGANFWGWEFDQGSEFMSQVETPEIANWLKYYSGLLAATNNQTTSTTSSTVSTTASSATSSITTAPPSSSSSTTSVVTSSSASQTVTQSSSSSTTGGGGIPGFPNQLPIASAFAITLIALYLLVRRRSIRAGSHAPIG